MKQLAWLRLRAKVTHRALRTVFASPVYVLLAAAVAALFMGLLIWAPNLQLLGYILFESPLSPLQKLAFIGQGYLGYFVNYDQALAVSGLLFVALAGINMALLAWVLKRRAAGAGVGARRSGAASVAAVLGSGCAACGTGVLAPVLAATAAGGTVFSAEKFFLINTLGTGLNLLGIALMLYSIAGLSKAVLGLRQQAQVPGRAS